MNRPFRIRLDPMKREAVMISECEGAFVIEPMQFLRVEEAKVIARQGQVA